MSFGVVFDTIKVNIDEKVIAEFKKYEQSVGRCEQGGILLGKYNPTDREYVITDITIPGSNDKQGPFFFVRDRIDAQEQINEYWNESDGIINYLGEWHTHPQEYPIPSHVDNALIRQVIDDGSVIWPEMLMIIVGIKNTITLIVTEKSIENRKQYKKEMKY